MNDITIGQGKRAGKGVYATRDFEAGERVVAYQLKELTQAEFDALPPDEREWTHSFWGKIYLFPEPERYVNHDGHPNTYPDLDKMGDYALRPIKKGEAITINNRDELQHELDTFLEAYEKAANSRNFDNVVPLIADEATFWFTEGSFTGKAAIREAFEATYSYIQDEVYSISDVQWVAATYWTSAYTYTFKSDGLVNGTRQIYTGRGTNILRRIDGSWRIVHEHLSK